MSALRYGAALSMEALIPGRAICGFGGAGSCCGVLTLFAVTITEHERPMYIALTRVTWSLETVLGPIYWRRLCRSLCKLPTL